MDHDPKYLFTKVINVTYEAGAQSDLFLTFLYTIMDGDKERMEYLQKLFGYCLTSGIENEEFYLLYGSSTRNGKSTLVETIAHLMGQGYALNVAPETWQYIKRNSRAASGDIARLASAKMVHSGEIPKGMTLDSGLLKLVTGDDSVTTRFMFKDEFEFKPKFKLILNANRLPKVSDDTIFTSGRVKVIPFNHHFNEDEADITMKSKLISPSELSGILNWMLEGLSKYERDGLTPPQSVKEATEAYVNGGDQVDQFFANVTRTRPGAYIKAYDVFLKYDEWCTMTNRTSEGKYTFYDLLREKGYMVERATVQGKSIRHVVKDISFKY